MKKYRNFNRMIILVKIAKIDPNQTAKDWFGLVWI